MNISYIVYHTIKCCFVLGSTTVAIVTLSQTILLTNQNKLKLPLSAGCNSIRPPGRRGRTHRLPAGRPGHR